MIWRVLYGIVDNSMDVCYVTRAEPIWYLRYRRQKMCNQQPKVWERSLSPRFSLSLQKFLAVVVFCVGQSSTNYDSNP